MSLSDFAKEFPVEVAQSETSSLLIFETSRLSADVFGGAWALGRETGVRKLSYNWRPY